VCWEPHCLYTQLCAVYLIFILFQLYVKYLHASFATKLGEGKGFISTKKPTTRIRNTAPTQREGDSVFHLTYPYINGLLFFFVQKTYSLLNAIITFTSFCHDFENILKECHGSFSPWVLDSLLSLSQLSSISASAVFYLCLS